jgi:hypothetical protein
MLSATLKKFIMVIVMMPLKLNDTQYNDTQSEGLICATQHNDV